MPQFDLLQGIGIGLMGLFAFLARSFVSRIHDDFKDLKSSVDKLCGKLDAIQDDYRELSTRVAVTRQEVRALWRTVDAPQRVSDTGNGTDEGDY